MRKQKRQPALIPGSYAAAFKHFTEDSFAQLTLAEHGCTSAHYNGYYLAALLLAYKYDKNDRYLEVGRQGLETLMSLYPETRREQSETEEMCRLVLPLAVLYDVTGDEWFHTLWKDVVRFCIKSQTISDNPLYNGAWCRAFDMELGEAYGCPHDAGWAAYACETGWTISEILMGMMMPDILWK